MTVFLSYSSRDRDAVRNLVQDLSDADEQVWMDRRLAGGDAWWRAILEQIRGCDVFIFALSQHSIESKPCQAELQYAQALDLPVLPVQVGPVDSMQLNPLATVQTVDYRAPTPSTAMRLLSALNRARAQRQPLPEPLPEEPSVPFEYLIRLYTTISNPEYLSPRDQAVLVAQLQVGLREDGQHEAARNDIVTLLRKLHDREDITHRTLMEVDAILASIDAESRPRPPMDTETVAQAEQPPSPPRSTLIDDHVRPTQPPAPDAARQRPAYLTVDAPQHHPPSWPPVPQSGPAGQPGAWPGQYPPPNQPAAPPIPTGVGGISRRTTIALIGGAVALVAVIVAVVGISALSKHGPSESSPAPSSFPTSSSSPTFSSSPTSSSSSSSPTMSGHYIRTETNPRNGMNSDDDWYFTPCGDGCASVALSPGGPTYGRSQLVNGQWTMDATDNQSCTDGSTVSDVNTVHYTWDPDTLAGTVQVTQKFAVCGDSAPQSFTNNVQLRQKA